MGDFYRALSEVKNFHAFDMVLLECGPALEGKIQLKPTSHPSFLQIFGGGNNAGCYITTPSYSEKNMQIWNQHPEIHIDHSWQKLWKHNKVYLHRPVVFVQLGLASNIENLVRKETPPFDFDLWEQKQGKALK